MLPDCKEKANFAEYQSNPKLSLNTPPSLFTSEQNNSKWQNFQVELRIFYSRIDCSPSLPLWRCKDTYIYIGFKFTSEMGKHSNCRERDENGSNKMTRQPAWDCPHRSFGTWHQLIQVKRHSTMEQWMEVRTTGQFIITAIPNKFKLTTTIIH